MAKVIIIGGGASGMAAAISAAGTGNAVTLIERQGRVGRKLLSTGNGRCNLTNIGAAPGEYRSAGGTGADFTAPVLARYTPSRVLEQFDALGLRTVTEYGGRVYPYSDQAGSVLDVLRLEMERRGIAVVTSAPVERIRSAAGGFTVSWEGGSLRGDRVIAACGGCAGQRVGGTAAGYALLRDLGHSIVPPRPALVPLRTEPEYPRALKGVRVNARAVLTGGKRAPAAVEGDVLFTDSGLSGSAIFDLSLPLAMAPEPEKLTVSLSFFPGETPERLAAVLAGNAARWPSEPANRIFTGLLQSRLGMMLCKRAGVGGKCTARALTERELRALADTALDFRLAVTGSGGFDSAQITAGGAQTAEFEPETLESRLVPGLYACGEVLDVAARCGGFNLHWAWASGMAAGEMR